MTDGKASPSIPAATRGPSWGPFPRRNVLWHSDESARPFVGDVDPNVLAIAPSGHEFGIENVNDFKQFIAMCQREKIKVTLAEGWALECSSGIQCATETGR